MEACGADSAARCRWQPFESSGQRWAAAHAFVAQPVYAAITTQSNTHPCLIEQPMRCDGMVGGGGGWGVGVFQPGRLHLMRVMQQASWWVFPLNSCRHNFSHLINELGTLQQIQWHGPAPPPAPSPPAAPSAVQCQGSLFIPRVPSLIWHTFQTLSKPRAERLADAVRLLALGGRGKKNPTKNAKCAKWEAPAWVAADVWWDLPGQQLAAAKLRWRHVRLLFIIVFTLLRRDAGMSKSWRTKIRAFVLLSLHFYFAKTCIVVEIVTDVLFMCVAGERCRSFIDLAPPSEKGECGTPGPPELPNIKTGLRYFHSTFTKLII